MRLNKFIAVLLALFANLIAVSPVFAIPGLPSSFYGSVTVNSATVPDGTLVQASIGGQVYAEGYTQTYQGKSVYALDVRGDDTDTAIQDGGREGDTIVFKIGNLTADQTGTWHSGVNTNLDLGAVSPTPLITPQPTLTVLPTQTAIVTVIPPATPTPAVTASKSVNTTPPPEGTPGLGPTPFNPGEFIPRTQTMAPTSRPGVVLNPKTPTASPQPATQSAKKEVEPFPLPSGNEDQNEKETSSMTIGTTIILVLAGIVLVLLAVLLWNKFIHR